ncbi:integrase [Streptomyces sp. NPDC057253]|uniref:integrase n=1 Tax=Streptomyces sp. NPDC057253 TaxID=3346069 RepID=UPI0036372F03
MATTSTESPPRGMQLTELLALPVAFDLETSNRALQLGRTKGFQLAKQGEYPVRVLRVGHTYRVTRADLLRALGIDPNGGGAGSSHPTPPNENALTNQR